MKMENYLILNGEKIELASVRYEEIAKAIASLKEESCFDRVNRDCTYFFITSGDSVAQLPDSKMREDDDRYDSANYCTNQQLTEQRASYEKGERNLWRFSKENGETGSWIIYYDTNHDRWGIIWRSANISAIFQNGRNYSTSD